MDVESEVDRLLSNDDECPHCNGMGKLNKPGAPDCPHCKGTGVTGSFRQGYPKNRAKRSPKTGSTTL
jgi:DnaJ-class molecular chaperone